MTAVQEASQLIIHWFGECHFCLLETSCARHCGIRGTV